MKLVYSILLAVICVSSCRGQAKTDAKRPSVSDSAVKLKMIKSNGVSKYAAVGSGLLDKAGNLWFTGVGVYRYNTGEGYLTHFTEKNGLSSNKVSSIAEDKKGNIWVCTDGRVCRYDGKTFTSIHIPVNNEIGFIPGSAKQSASNATAVWRVFCDKKGNIWFGINNDGVYKYDGISFTHFLHGDGITNSSKLSLNAVSCIMEDRAGNMWFTTWFEGICRYDGKSITNFKPNGEVWYAGIFEDRNGNVWAGRRSNGVCRADAAELTGKGPVVFDNVLQHGYFDSCCLYAMAEDKAGNIWFATEADNMSERETRGGVWRYGPSTALNKEPVFKNFTVEDGLSNNAVFSITVDRSGALWFGTRNLGLSRYDASASPAFTNFTDRSNEY